MDTRCERARGNTWRALGGYLAELRQFLAECRHGCRDHSIDYALIDTSRPFDEALSAYLAHRRGVTTRRR